MKFVDGSRPALLALLTGAAITAFVTFSLAREHATTVAVASSETQNVTRALEEHARDFPAGQLAEEREALAIQALAQAGRKAEAAARGSAFRARWPTSVLTPVVDAALR